MKHWLQVAVQALSTEGKSKGKNGGTKNRQAKPISEIEIEIEKPRLRIYEEFTCSKSTFLESTSEKRDKTNDIPILSRSTSSYTLERSWRTEVKVEFVVPSPVVEIWNKEEKTVPCISSIRSMPKLRNTWNNDTQSKKLPPLPVAKAPKKEVPCGKAPPTPPQSPVIKEFKSNDAREAPTIPSIPFLPKLRSSWINESSTIQPTTPSSPQIAEPESKTTIVLPVQQPHKRSKAGQVEEIHNIPVKSSILRQKPTSSWIKAPVVTTAPVIAAPIISAPAALKSETGDTPALPAFTFPSTDEPTTKNDRVLVPSIPSIPSLPRLRSSWITETSMLQAPVISAPITFANKPEETTILPLFPETTTVESVEVEEKPVSKQRSAWSLRIVKNREVTDVNVAIQAPSTLIPSTITEKRTEEAKRDICTSKPSSPTQTSPPVANSQSRYRRAKATSPKTQESPDLSKQGQASPPARTWSIKSQSESPPPSKDFPKPFPWTLPIRSLSTKSKPPSPQLPSPPSSPSTNTKRQSLDPLLQTNYNPALISYIDNGRIQNPNSLRRRNTSSTSTIFTNSPTAPITIIVTTPEEEYPPTPSPEPSPSLSFSPEPEAEPQPEPQPRNSFHAIRALRKAASKPWPGPQTQKLQAQEPKERSSLESISDTTRLMPPTENQINAARLRKTQEYHMIRQFLISFLNIRGHELPRKLREKLMMMYKVNEVDLFSATLENFMIRDENEEDEGVSLEGEIGEEDGEEMLRRLKLAFRRVQVPLPIPVVQGGKARQRFPAEAMPPTPPPEVTVQMQRRWTPAPQRDIAPHTQPRRNDSLRRSSSIKSLQAFHQPAPQHQPKIQPHPRLHHHRSLPADPGPPANIDWIVPVLSNPSSTTTSLSLPVHKNTNTPYQAAEQTQFHPHLRLQPQYSPQPQYQPRPQPRSRLSLDYDQEAEQRLMRANSIPDFHPLTPSPRIRPPLPHFQTYPSLSYPPSVHEERRWATRSSFKGGGTGSLTSWSSSSVGSRSSLKSEGGGPRKRKSVRFKDVGLEERSDCISWESATRMKTGGGAARVGGWGMLGMGRRGADGLLVESGYRR